MTSVFRGSISNTGTTSSFFIHIDADTTSLPALSQYVDELQSSSVTPSGSLWSQRLAQIAYENSLTISQNDLHEIRQNIAQAEKRQALIHLLRSWREGDEQEQRNTWEYLKQALDEDRSSERKLFP